MAQRFPKRFLYLLGVLFFLNFAQSFFTELIYDESYYRYYSQHMDWGYFDHPPMVAFLIKISSFLFQGELGVRFMTCLLGAGTFAILWLLIDHKEKDKFIPHFFLFAFALPLLNAYGFLTLPDTPLLFFTALFLWTYKGFLKKSNLVNAIFLGLTMAALMYSKYHAVLVILFVLFSNLALLKNRYAWLAVFVAIGGYAPHIFWLFENDFVSVKYHLFDRPNHPYDFAEFTLGYFLNLIVNFGLLFPWAYWALFKARPKDKFSKALIYLSYGVILFFFVSSFAKRTQAQWVIVLCIPIGVIAFEYLLNRSKSRKWMIRFSLVSLVILLYARLWLVHQPLLPMVFETHGNKKWVTNLKNEVGEIPVIFENGYRPTSMYAFYSGGKSFSLNNIFYRRNQFSIDSSEFKVQHQKVAYVTKYASKGDFEHFMPDGDKYFGKYIDNFESYRKLRCYIDEDEVPLNLGKSGTIQLKIYNPYQDDIALDKIKLHVGYLNSYKELKERKPVIFEPKDESIQYLISRDTTYFKCKLPLPSIENVSYLKFGIAENGLHPGLNSTNIKIEK